MKKAESFRAGLRRPHLDRVPVVSQPPSFLESTRSNASSPKTLGLKSEHVLCASVRGCCTCYPGETNALAFSEFSRQRAGSRSRRGEFALSDYVLVQTRINKALGISVTTRDGDNRFEEGSRGVE
jgi:hypothetical protein